MASTLGPLRMLPGGFVRCYELPRRRRKDLFWNMGGCLVSDYFCLIDKQFQIFFLIDKQFQMLLSIKILVTDKSRKK